RRIQEESPETHVILMTGRGSVKDAVTAMREKAVDYLVKPFALDHLQRLLDSIADERRERHDLDHARLRVASMGAAAAMEGESPAIVHLRERINAIAPSDSPVLLTGECGTGKELIAQTIHERSNRSGEPFVTINCGAFPEH